MQCPSCSTENEAGNQVCGRCGARLPATPLSATSGGEGKVRGRRRRENSVASEAAVNPWIQSSNRLATVAYQCSLWAIIPFFGLLLGPAAVVLGLLGRRRERRQPTELGGGHATAAVVLGGVTLLTNWAGLFFLLRGIS
jgi:hypothetical protein